MLTDKKTKNNEDYLHSNFNYKYIQSSITKLFCCSFAFNKSSIILFIGAYMGRIKIYGFNNKLKQVQTLKEINDGFILQILFIKKSNELINSNSKNIVIWNLDKNNFWRTKQSWTAHQYIQCVIINNDEDMLISGGIDKQIQFWENKPSGWSCFQAIDSQQLVSCLSLNSSEKKLIASGLMRNILVIELKPNKQWMINQTIEVKDGSQLGFINDNSFVLQLIGIDFLEIYDYDRNNFIKVNNKKSKQWIRLRVLYQVQLNINQK